MGGFGRGSRAIVLAIALTMGCANAARADVASVAFDEHPAGTQITTQYEAKGVTFADGANGATGFTPTIMPPPGAGSAPPACSAASRAARAPASSPSATSTCG